MSDLNSVSNHPVTQRPMSPDNPNAASWRQVLKSAMEQSTWMRFRGGERPSHMSQKLRISLQSLRNRKYLTISLVFVATLGMLIVFGIIRYATLPGTVKQAHRTVASGKSLLGLAHSTKPKPAPGKPFAPVTQQHLPLPTWSQTPPAQQTSSSPVVPQAPQAPVTSPVPAPLASAPSAQPLLSAKTSFPPLVYQARHDKHFGGSCSGQLTLAASGLAFHCSDDPNGSVQVPLNQIGAVDENGILLLSGKKYHFSIPGMTKDAEQAVFANWLHQVR